MFFCFCCLQKHNTFTLKLLLWFDISNDLLLLWNYGGYYTCYWILFTAFIKNHMVLSQIYFLNAFCVSLLFFLKSCVILSHSFKYTYFMQGFIGFSSLSRPVTEAVKSQLPKTAYWHLISALFFSSQFKCHLIYKISSVSLSGK